MSINHKKIFECLVVFEKYFVFTKIVKISKTMLLYSGDSITGWSSRMSQSRNILRIFFKIWDFNISRCSDWRLVRKCRFQSWGYLEIFAAYFTTLSWIELPVAKNTKQIFQNFFLSVLVIGPDDLHITRFNRENCVFYTTRAFS